MSTKTPELYIIIDNILHKPSGRMTPLGTDHQSCVTVEHSGMTTTFVPSSALCNYTVSLDGTDMIKWQ